MEKQQKDSMVNRREMMHKTVQNHCWKRLPNYHALLTLFLLLLVAPTTLAATIDAVTIKDSMTPDGFGLDSTLHIVAHSDVQDPITIPLPADATTITVQNTSFSVVNNEITFAQPCNGCTITVTYHTTAGIHQGSNGLNALIRTFTFPLLADQWTYELLLPELFILSGTADQAIPAPTTITTSGTQIRLTWKDQRPTMPLAYVIQFKNEESLEENAITEDLTEWSTWVLGIILLFLGAGFGYFYHQRQQRTTLPNATVEIIPGNLLSRDERAIVKLLMDQQQPIHQKDIGKTLAWSKSKVSGVIATLDQKEIIKREKVGKSFTVTLVRTVTLDS